MIKSTYGKKSYSYLLSQLSSDVTKSFDTIKAHCFQSSVTEHFRNLSVLLAIFLENKLSFLGFVLVLSSPTILTSLT